MKYYIAENGQQAGPFEPNELLLHGLTANSLVWCEGMANWTSASQIPELMALLSGQTFNPGNIDTQLPQTPPMGDIQLPQVPPMGQQPTQLPQVPPITSGGQQQGTTNQPYVPTQKGPSSTPTNTLMPKTWLTESILATVASLLCCFNWVGLATGIFAIFKANSVKTKFNKGDTEGANKDSSTAKMLVLITVGVGLVWFLVQVYRLVTDPNFLQQIQEGSIGQLYGL